MKGKWLNRAGACALLLGLAVFPNQAFPRDGAERESDRDPSELEVSFDQGMVSVKARNVNLSDILQLIATNTGMMIVLDEQADHPVSMEIDRIEVEAVLKHLLRTVNHAGLWVEEKPGRKAGIRLAALYVYPRGKSSAGPEVRILSGPMEPSAAPPAADRVKVNSSLSVSAGTVPGMSSEGLERYIERKRMKAYIEQKRKKKEKGAGENGFESYSSGETALAAYIENKQNILKLYGKTVEAQIP